MHSIVRVIEVMLAIFIQFQLSCVLQCLLLTTLILQSTAVGCFPLENCNPWLEYYDSNGVGARVDIGSLILCNVSVP